MDLQMLKLVKICPISRSGEGQSPATIRAERLCIANHEKRFALLAASITFSFENLCFGAIACILSFLK